MFSLTPRGWWEEGGDRAKDLFAEVDRIDDENQDREQAIYDAYALVNDTGVFAHMSDVADILLAHNEMSHNVVSTAVDALVAEVTQSVVRPMAITIGGTFDQRKKAEKMTQYFEAQWDLHGIHGIMCQAVRDNIICGMGIVRVGHANVMDPKNDRPVVERIFPGNFLIDDSGSVDVMPREFYVRRLVPRHHLAALFPDFRDEIMSAANATHVFWANPNRRHTHVEVIEAYHLASAPGRKDGRRVLAIRGHVLVDEEYDREDTCYKVIRGLPAAMGFWGEMLAMRARPAQQELNKLLVRVQESMHLISVPRVFVPRQGQIVSGHLTNDIGILIEYDGPTPPTFHVPQAAPNELYNHIDRLEQWIYKELGVSELSAVSQKPSGLSSGAALRTYSDVQTRRFINYVRGYERCCEEVARELALVNMDIAKKHSGHRVSTYYKRRYESFKWSELSLDPERFVIRIFSASALPNTPAGRLQALQEMVKAGVIDQQTFIKMADVPDLESVRRLLLAGDELLEELLERMVSDEDFYEPPDPGMDLNKAKVMATLAYYRGKLDEVPEERLAKLIQFVDECGAIEEMALAAVPPMPPEGDMLGAANAMAMQAPPMAGVPQLMPPEVSPELMGDLGAGMPTVPGGTDAPFQNI